MLARLFLIALVLLLSGCSHLPMPKVLQDGFPVISKPKPLDPTVRASIGAGKYQGDHDVMTASLEVEQPIVDFDIAILITGDPEKDKLYPPLILSGIARGEYTVSSSANDGVNLKTGYAGVTLGTPTGKVGFMTNEADYVLTAEGFKQLTNVLRLRSGVEYKNSYSDDDNSGGATKLYTGLDYRYNCDWTIGGTYEKGESTPGDSDSRVLLNIGWNDNDCAS